MLGRIMLHINTTPTRKYFLLNLGIYTNFARQYWGALYAGLQCGLFPAPVVSPASSSPGQLGGHPSVPGAAAAGGIAGTSLRPICTLVRQTPHRVVCTWHWRPTIVHWACLSWIVVYGLLFFINASKKTAVWPVYSLLYRQLSCLYTVYCIDLP